MSTKDQQTLAKAIFSQALHDLRSPSRRRRSSARRWLRPSPRLLAFASVAGLRASEIVFALAPSIPGRPTRTSKVQQ